MKSLIEFFILEKPLFLFFVLVCLFFHPLFFQGKIPLPADTIVGMYHPWREVIWDNLKSGVPFKNFLITDPVRQQYVWRYLAIEEFKKGRLPLWNPYSFSGSPLLANFQTAGFYPLNILFFIFSFDFAWGILVFLQPLLAGCFFYLYLRFLKKSPLASLFGALIFAFSGFSIAWLEWNTILHVILWLPLILLSIEKIVTYLKERDLGLLNGKKIIRVSNKFFLFWAVVFLFSLLFSFFAGHLQVFFYSFFLIISYFFFKIIFFLRNRIQLIFFVLFTFFFFVFLSYFQWLTTFKFIQLSARDIDQSFLINPGWFFPFKHLIQFLAPDFFGNPSTLNYWGEWNYGEFLGYIGVFPLILAFYAIFLLQDKESLFFKGICIIALIFALPTPFAKMPYQWHLPFFSTIQPTRLLVLIDFSLSVLSAFGLDLFLKNKVEGSKIFRLWVFFGIIYGFLWLMISFFPLLFFPTIKQQDILVAKRNLIFPTFLFIFLGILFFLYLSNRKKENKILNPFLGFIFFSFTIFDLFRLGWKFNPFVKREWIFPLTKSIQFLQNQPKPFRFLTTDRRIFPSNFSIFYHLEDVGGYDSLYLRDYAQLVSSWNSGQAEINFGSFNRIITPQNYTSKIADLLNVKYVLTLKEEFSPKLRLVFKEGETRIYENTLVYPRAFLVYDYQVVKDRKEALKQLFAQDFDLRKKAILEEEPGIKILKEDKNGKVKILSYEPQKIVLETQSQTQALLIFSDIFYPDWQAFLDEKKESEKIYKVNFAFRGVFVPEGKHRLVFLISL